MIIFMERMSEELTFTYIIDKVTKNISYQGLQRLVIIKDSQEVQVAFNIFLTTENLR
jgi:hypothetical protein